MLQRDTYSAISFDVGFTLIDSVADAPAIVTAALAPAGIVPDAASLARAHRRAEQLFLADYFRPFNDTWEHDERIVRLYRRYYGQLLADLDAPQADDRMADQIIERYLAPDNWRLLPDVRETLAELHAQGFRLGIASDWGSGLTRILHGLGLSRYLDWALISGGIGFAKPSIEFFRLVAQRAGVDAARIVHVGDSYFADVRGARAVGMEPVLIDWQRRTWPPLDVPLIHTLRDLPTLLGHPAKA